MGRRHYRDVAEGLIFGNQTVSRPLAERDADPHPPCSPGLQAPAAPQPPSGGCGMRLQVSFITNGKSWNLRSRRRRQRNNVIYRQHRYAYFLSLVGD